MSSDKNTLAHPDAVTRVFNSIIEFFQELNSHPDSEYIDGGNLVMASSNVAHQIANVVLQANFDPAAIDADIQKVIGYFRDKALPFSWLVWPTSSPNNLEDRLLANGLTYLYAAPDMIASLSDLPAEVPQTEELRIERVTSEKMLADWRVPFEHSFQLPDNVNQFFIDIFLHLGLEENKSARHFAAYLEGNPVACSTVFLGSDGVAGIWNVASSPEARGKGIGTAVTWKACEEASRQGYTHAILRSSEMGYNVYQRLGFEEYFKDQVYIWQPSE